MPVRFDEEYMGRSFKKVIYVLMPFLVYYVVHDVTRILMMYALQFISSHSTGAYSLIKANDALFSGIISFLDMLIGAAVLLILMKRDPEELSVWDYVNLNGSSFYRQDRLHPAAFSWILIAVQAVSMALGLNILIGLSGVMRLSSFSESVGAQYSIPLWLGLILYGVVSPGVEELLFRTIVFGRMKRRFSYVTAVIVSSMFFGLYHRNLVQGLYGFAMGVLMCMACEYLHTVVAAFMVHALANLTIYLLGMRGLLANLGTVNYCLVFLGIGVLTILAEGCFSVMSVRRFGTVEGIEHVGVFYVDPTLTETDENDPEAYT